MKRFGVQGGARAFGGETSSSSAISSAHHRFNMWNRLMWGAPIFVPNSSSTSMLGCSSDRDQYPESLRWNLLSSPFIGSWSGSGATTTPAAAQMHQQLRFHGGGGGGGRGKSGHGQKRTLSFEERMERRRPKSKDEKMAKEQQIDALNNMIDVEYPQDLEDMVAHYREEAERARDLLANPGSVIEKLEVEIQGQNRPMPQLATLVRESSTVYFLTPLKAPFLNPIVSKIMKMGDTGLQVSKEGTSGKVRIVAPPMTQERRLNAVESIKDIEKIAKDKIDSHSEAVVSELNEQGRPLGIGDSIVMAMTEKVQTAARDTKELLEMELSDMEADIMSVGADEDEGGAPPA